MGLVCGCQLMPGPLDPEAIRRSVEDLNLPAVVVYCAEAAGSGRQTISTDEERALFQMFAIAEESANRWKAHVALAQRLGEVMSGDVTLVVAAACDSVDRAFACGRFMAEQVGQRVPVENHPGEDSG